MAKAIPDDVRGIIPHLVVGDGARAIEFYKVAFGAEEVSRMPAPDGRLLHAMLRIGDACVYLCDDFPEMCGGMSRDPQKLGASPVVIHRYVEDCDAAVKRAADAGATVTMAPEDMFWGDRFGTVQDPFGHTWSFATHVRDLTPEEIMEAGRAAFG